VVTTSFHLREARASSGGPASTRLKNREFIFSGLYYFQLFLSSSVLNRRASIKITDSKLFIYFISQLILRLFG
jgi:hypothetical protein